MIRTRTITNEVRECFCDVPDCVQRAPYRCPLCGRDICRNHSIYGDGIFCLSCWSIGEPFRAKIDEARADFERVETELEAAWAAAAKAGVARQASAGSEVRP